VSRGTLLGDRREYPRFEVAGQFWAALTFDAEVVVRNVATRGVLIETTLASPFKPIRAARITLGGGVPTLDAVVRHVTPAPSSGEPGTRYLVGLEFVNVPPTARVNVERLLRDWHDRASR
jgi:hypothetical protein